MSFAEEEVELKYLLEQALEKNGCLAKIRAELRASLFHALDEDVKLSKQQPLKNTRVLTYLQTSEGRTMFCLVREFLEFFNLQFTISVYEPESYLDSIGQYQGRNKIARELGLDNIAKPSIPLLQHFLQISQEKCKHLNIDLNLNDDSRICITDNPDSDSSYKKTVSPNITLGSDENQESLNFNNISQNNALDISNPKGIFSPTKTPFENNTHIVDSMFPRNIIRKKEAVENSTFDRGPLLETFLDTVLEDSKLINVKSGSRANEMNMTLNKIIPLPRLDEVKEDTYQETSLLTEDSESAEKVNDISNTSHIDINVPLKNVPIENLNNQKTSQNVIHNLNSLSDLPALPGNKTRVSNEILPSMYNKDFKHKSSMKDLDKVFDIDAEYEEDFIYSSEISLSPLVSNSTQASLNVNNHDISEDNLEILNLINENDRKIISNIGNPILKNCSNQLKNGTVGGNSSTDLKPGPINSSQ